MTWKKDLKTEVKHNSSNQFSDFEIVHVVESCSGGTLSAAIHYINEQVDLGAMCTFVYLERQESPSLKKLQEILPSSCKIHPLGESSLKGLIKLCIYLLKELKHTKTKRIYHLHSSWAGLLGKAILGRRRQVNLFYTPHGFSFMRRDISRFLRLCFWLIEYLTNKSSYVHIICTSQHEEELALQAGANTTSVIRNAVDTELLLKIRHCVKRGQSPVPRVGTLGRITEAKNPERFAKLSLMVKNTNQIIWIGDGERDLFGETNYEFIEVTGWLEREYALEQLASLDIFVLLSDWESFPFCVIEAQSMGIPCIVWDFPSARELVSDSIDGFVINSLEDAARLIMEINESPEMANHLQVNSIEKSLTNYSLSIFRRNIEETYMWYVQR